MKKVLSLIGLCAICTGAVAATGASAPAKPAGAKHVEFLDSGRFDGLPFSDGVRVGNLTYLSGEIGYAKDSKKLVPGGIKPESRQVLENIKASAEAHGYTMKDIVKCTVMLADMAEWATFNEVYKEFFSKPYPARSAFGASGLANNARVEVECIAAK